MVLNDEARTWFRLHERRSSLHERSKLGETNACKQTIAAAMTQFEEQFTAAKTVTAATRPLNLYYGLAQADMAIAAAHAPDPWSFSRHGLRLGDRNPELADMLVGPEGEGGFQKVGAATGSPLITASVSLGCCGRPCRTWPSPARCLAQRGASPSRCPLTYSGPRARGRRSTCTARCPRSRTPGWLRSRP